MNPFLHPTVAKPAHTRSSAAVQHDSIEPQTQSVQPGADNHPAYKQVDAAKCIPSPSVLTQKPSLRSVPTSVVTIPSIFQRFVSQQVLWGTVRRSAYLGRLRRVCLHYAPTISAFVVSIASALIFATFAHAVEVNTADATALQTLRGIGPKMAEQIVEERKRGGDFMDAQDLQERVRGMGPKTMQRLLDSGLTVTVQKPSATPNDEKSK